MKEIQDGGTHVFLEIFQRKIHIKYNCILILITLFEVIKLQHFVAFVFSKISDGRHTVWSRVEREFFKSIKWRRFQTGNRKIIDLHSFAFLKSGRIFTLVLGFRDSILVLPPF
jgi:hypothetical protein